ncbi:uncharacterized protein PHALS_00666 [Plasmopara halstedii]|uniref:Uncharacterized protein n=1 Tax=Plasmopara halstedii TaxID=4781 RepID=A0A0P1ASN0_PLAHL|nr:uncharacterized protein PHALS_00666 [Plasmopara halstedii]CEG44297.1 hypothetical protein PHALS_00666 [Plasmopara halstedii]|eukprot:XP_024580666.1 hypothetical protein PHALS_00666 [Plasmopara halstedii]
MELHSVRLLHYIQFIYRCIFLGISIDTLTPKDCRECVNTCLYEGHVKQFSIRFLHNIQAERLYSRLCSWRMSTLRLPNHTPN